MLDVDTAIHDHMSMRGIANLTNPTKIAIPKDAQSMMIDGILKC